MNSAGKTTEGAGRLQTSAGFFCPFNSDSFDMNFSQSASRNYSQLTHDILHNASLIAPKLHFFCHNTITRFFSIPAISKMLAPKKDFPYDLDIIHFPKNIFGKNSTDKDHNQNQKTN
jgi:hypothetical protein